MNTIRWIVDSVMSHDEMFGEKDVVFAINFRVVAEIDGISYNAINGTTGVTYNEQSTFKPLLELSNDDFISWVHDSLSQESKESLEAQALQKIQNITLTTL